MMKYFLRSLVVLFIVANSYSAQQLYFCESHTEDGSPIDAKNIWEMKPWGRNIEILYQSESGPIGDPVVYIFFDKLENGSYLPFDSKALRIDPGRDWFYYTYKFTDKGTYEIYLRNSQQQNMAKETITINYEDTYNRVSNPYNSRYYDNAEIIFCERVVAGKPLNIRYTLPMGSGGAEVYIMLRQNKPLKTEKIILNIWRKKFRTLDYDEFIDTKKYKIDPEWADTFFKYSFTEPGEYKLSIYNENEILIKSGYITVYD